MPWTPQIGCSHETFLRLMEKLKLSEDKMFAVLFFLRQGCTFADLSAEMEAHHYSGWTKDVVADKLKHVMLMAAITARAEIRNNTAAVLKHQDNVVKGSYLGHPVVGSLDTVPVTSYAFEKGMFTKKAGRDNYKFLVGTSNTGHLLDPLYGPCKGSKGDNRMLHDSGLLATIAKSGVKNGKLLADCAFADPQIIKPSTITQVGAAKKGDRYDMAYANEKIGLLRSFVEHGFSRMMIGRFGVVKLWRFDDKEFLQSSFAVCCFVVETETLVHHGLGTRYASAFDTDAAEANAAELRTFTNRYKKKVQEQKKVKEQKKKVKAKKKKLSNTRGVKKQAPRNQTKVVAVAPKGKRIRMANVVATIKRKYVKK